MKKEKFIYLKSFLIGILTLISVNIAAQNFTFKNPVTGMYELTEYEVDQMYRNDDEVILLRLEVEQQYLGIENLTTIAEKQKEVIIDKSAQIIDHMRIISLKNEQLELYKDLEGNCSMMYGIYEDKIKHLEWELTKEKVKNTYLQVGGGVTATIIGAIVIRELIK
jgi:hypothetical protein